jgi:hypothetical protein
MVWLGGPKRDPSDHLGRGRRGIWLHDPPPGYQAPRAKVSAKERQRVARREWVLEHVLAVLLSLLVVALVVIFCVALAIHH